MSAAAKAAFEKRIDHFQCNSLTDDPCTEGKYVCIVVLAADPCSVFIVRKCTADSLELIACDRDSDACSADGDTLLCFAGEDVLGDEFSCLNP